MALPQQEIFWALVILVMVIASGLIRSFVQVNQPEHVVRVAITGHNFISAMPGFYLLMAFALGFESTGMVVLRTVVLCLAATPCFNLLALLLTGGEKHAGGQFPPIGYGPATVKESHWLNWISTSLNVVAILASLALVVILVVILVGRLS